MHNKHYKFRKTKTTYILERREYLGISDVLVDIYICSFWRACQRERTGEPLPSHMVQMEHVNSNMAVSIARAGLL